MNPQHDPLDPQERTLARLLAESPPPEPSAELDARILAASRSAVPTPAKPTVPGPAAATHRRRRWPVALGLAASVTLAVGVAWQLREPPLPDAAVAPSETPPLPDAPVPLVEPGPQPVVPTLPAPAASPAVAPATRTVMQPGQDQAAVAAAAERARQRKDKATRQVELQAAGEAAVRAEEARVQEAATAAAAQRTNQRLEQAARQEAAAPAPPAPSAPPPAAAPAAVADSVEAEATIAAEPRADAYASPEPAAPPPPASLSTDVLEADDLPPAEAAAVGEDERLAAPEWLQRIRERRARGEIEQARASLERFMVTHPTTPVPEDLQPLAP